MRIEPEQLNQLLRPIFDPTTRRRRSRRAGCWPRACPPAPAPPPAASCSTPRTPVAWAARGEKVLLVRDFTSPEDIRGMDAAQGILTALGGMTSPRRARRPPDGQGLHRRLRRARHRLCKARTLQRRRRRRSRKATGIASTASPARSSSAQLETRPREVAAGADREELKPEESRVVPLLRRDHGVGRQGSASCSVRTNADQPDQARTPSPSAPRASACAAPSTCSSSGERIMSDARDDPGRDTRGRARRRSPSSCRSSATTSPASSGSWTAARSPIRTLDPPLHEFLPHDAEEHGASCAQAARRAGRGGRANASTTCTSSTRCSATAAAGWASSTRRSPRCRRGRSSRPPATSRRKASTSHPEIMIPLVGIRRSSRTRRRSCARRPRTCSPSRASRSTTWSAR